MAIYIAILNSSVHIVMYSYYLLSSYKSQSVQAFVKLVKPLITLLQLIQFLFIIAECVIAILPTCNANFFFHVQIANFVILFALFGKFFIKTYCKGERK
jgi:GNS1/SUR4 family